MFYVDEICICSEKSDTVRRDLGERITISRSIVSITHVSKTYRSALGVCSLA